MYERFYYGTRFIICRSCSKISANDYQGFCSSACCVDYSIKNNLTFMDAKHGCVHCEVEDSGYHNCTLAERNRDLEYELENYDELKREELMDKDMENQKSVYNATKDCKDECRKLRLEKEELILAIRKLTQHSRRFQKMILEDYENNE